MAKKLESNATANEELLKKNENTESGPSIKVYKRRWLILFVFCLYASINSFQWIEYSSITNIVTKYYNVSTILVDWTSIIFMALYPVFVIPASYIIDKKGLRTAGLIGCIGTALGTSLKVFSIRNDLFSVVLLGQAIVSASQVVIICLPPKIASIWFKPEEVSTSCSLGVVATQLGNAIGFILPPILVQDSDNLEVIGQGLKVLSWVLTASMIPVTAAVITYFPNQPPKPPSSAQALLRESKEEFSTEVFFNSMKQLFINKGFVIHMVAYSINIAVFSGIGTLLSQFILKYFEGADEDAGKMGFCMVIAGMLGSIFFGILLDKTHKYKEITIFIYLFSSVSVICLMYALESRSKLLVYLACAMVGLFTNAYMPVGFELAIELTFPSEESSTTGILMASTQLLGVVFVVGLGYINRLVGCYWSLASQGLILFLGTVITWFVPNELRRLEAVKSGNKELGNLRKQSYHTSRLVYIE